MKADEEYADIIDALFARDPSIFVDDPVAQAEAASFLGWLDLPGRMREAAADLKAFADEVAPEIDHVVVLGMGGSSLGTEVLARAIGSREGYPEVLTLDSIVPGAMRAVRDRIDLARTLFVVASKSGTTIEPLSLEKWFARLLEAKGIDSAQRMIAITDPGTPLEKRARAGEMRRVFVNFEDVGGRFSVLSYFGLVPAALMGLDIEAILDAAEEEFRAARAHEGNVAGHLGSWLAGHALTGRNEMTLRVHPDATALTLWIEQLVAESTGKEGRGILPVAGEPEAEDPANYSDDRVFVLIGADRHRESLERGGQPVFTLPLDDDLSIFRQFVIWEVATAVAGAVLRVNPFDQPNVEESKVLAKRMLSGEMDPSAVLARATPIEAIASGIRSANYVAFLAWEEDSSRTAEIVAAIRREIVDRNGTTTTFGIGPRYLHSTGQYHKGGGEGGVHIFFVPEIGEDIEIPGGGGTFGELVRAQAAGDIQALEARDRVVYLVTTHDQLEEIRDAI